MTDPRERADAALDPRPDEAPIPPVTPAAAAVTEGLATGEMLLTVDPDALSEPAALPGEPTAAPELATVEPSTVVVSEARRTRPKAKPVTMARPLSPYAVIETGGKQYRVSVGDSLAVERLVAEAGGDVTIDRVLLLGGNGTTRVGTPTVAGASVTARIDDHYRGEKIVVFKYKAKKRYRRRMGHRQSLTRLTVTGITG